MKIILSFLMCMSVASCQTYQGRGLANQIDAGRDYALKDVKEITAFHAMCVMTNGRPVIHYWLGLDPKAIDLTMNGPCVRLLRDGVSIAVFRARVEALRDELVMEWQTDYDIDTNSYVSVQFYPDTEKLVTVRIPFHQARGSFQDGKQRHLGLSFGQFLNTIRERVRNLPSDPVAGRPDSD